MVLVRSQRIQNNLFLVNNQGIGVLTIMYNTSIKFPSRPKRMWQASIGTTSQRTLSLYFFLMKEIGDYLVNVATIIEPFQRVRLRMRNSKNTKLLNKKSGGHVSTTSSISNQVANLVLDSAPGVEDHFPLCLVIRRVLGM